MPQTVTDQDVATTRARVEALREEIAKEKSRASVVAASGANASSIAALDSEEVSLKAELSALKAANSGGAEISSPAFTSEPASPAVDYKNEVK